jgi:peptidoglycan/LPS O-acetylase OafA/YrhL
MLPTHADGLLIGALLAMTVRSGKVRSVSPLVSNIAGIAIAAFFLLGSMGVGGFVLYYGAWDTRETVLLYTVIAAAYGALLYLCIAGSLRRIFAARWLRVAGKYSYCLYLIHQGVAHLLNWTFQLWHVDESLQSSPLLLDAVHLIPLFAISFGLAALSWRLIERPILSFKRYFEFEPVRVVNTAPATS